MRFDSIRNSPRDSDDGRTYQSDLRQRFMGRTMNQVRRTRKNGAAGRRLWIGADSREELVILNHGRPNGDGYMRLRIGLVEMSSIGSIPIVLKARGHPVLDLT